VRPHRLWSKKPAPTRVAREELEHAEPAWRTAAWILRRAPELVGVLAAELEGAAQRVSLGQREPEMGDRMLLAAHGCLPTSERESVAHGALSNVVLVAGRALVERARSVSRPGTAQRVLVRPASR
jgi:hypothetical protein